MLFLGVEYVKASTKDIKKDRLGRIKNAHIDSKAIRVESDKTDLLEKHVTQ